MKQKKVILILLLVFTLLLSACNILPSRKAKSSGDAAGVYLDMAQDYIDKGDYNNAITILTKGFEETGSKEVEEALKSAIAAQLGGTYTPKESESEPDKKTLNPFAKAKEEKEEKKQEKKEEYSVTSRITGEEITAQSGISAGVYAMDKYNIGSPTKLIPYPVTWSGGQYKKIRSESGEKGIYFGFNADTIELTDSLMLDYVDALVSLGFNKREERLLTHMYYYLSIDGLPEIQISTYSVDRHYTSILLPPEYGFELEGTEVLSTFRVASVYTYPDWDENKDCCRISGFDGTVDGGTFLLYFAPGMYKEGDCLNLSDYLSQTNAGTTNSLYYCHFYSSQEGGNYCRTVTDALDKNSFNSFKDMDVQILKKDDQETVIYFYVEVDAGMGTRHRIEGIMNAATPGGEEMDASSVDPDGNCKNCGGKGYIECTSCRGKGEVECSLCGGDGKKYNVITKKQDLCTRCHGRKKQDCGFCDNGKKTCPVCGGKPKAA